MQVSWSYKFELSFQIFKILKWCMYTKRGIYLHFHLIFGTNLS